MNCPICRSINTNRVLRGVWDSPTRSIYKCEKCDTTFLFPMMTEKETADFYSHYQKHIKKREPNKNEFRRVEQRQKIEAKRQVGMLKKYLKADSSLCDIGASRGYFLSEVKKYVSDITAIEPGKEEAAILRKKAIPNFSWLEDLVEKKFDVITLFHCFEHIREPHIYLKLLNKFVAPKGLVVVELPNIDDALLSRYKIEEFKKFYFQSMHCFYYNRKTLSNVFSKYNFKLLKCFYVQRYGISNHMQWLLNGKPGGNPLFENKFKSIDNEYREVLIKEEISDTILCIFKKN